MKTIALAIENFSRGAGGAESYAVSLAEALIAGGWKVHLFGRSWDGQPPGAVFHPVAVPEHLPAWVQMLLFARRHRRQVAAAGCDVVLGFGNTVAMNVYQSHGGVHRISTAKKVYSEPSALKRAVKRALIRLSIKQWVRSWIESAPFRLRPRPVIVAISDMLRRDMQKAYGIAPEAVRVVYNGVDLDRYNPDLCRSIRGPLRQSLGISEDQTLFVMVSYDLKKKGIVPLVEAAGDLNRRFCGRFKVAVVGGDPPGAVKRRIEKLGLAQTVVFVGRVPSAEAYFANADVFVLPTFYDACSLVVFEAMACGLPVITTDANGAAGILTEAKEGFVILHPPSRIELAKKMEKLLDGNRRAAMGKSAARTAARYSIAQNHAQMLAVFEEVAGAGTNAKTKSR